MVYREAASCFAGRYQDGHLELLSKRRRWNCKIGSQKGCRLFLDVVMLGGIVVVIFWRLWRLLLKKLDDALVGGTGSMGIGFVQDSLIMQRMRQG
jgi:hypothetical protein